jgi:hypothetical protein
MLKTGWGGDSVGESEGKGVGGRRKRRVKSKGMQMVRSEGEGDVWGGGA